MFQRVLLLIGLVLCESCARRIQIASPATTAASSDREDSFEEAAAFYLLKRVPAGMELPVERIVEARRHAERMPQYSIARARAVGAGSKTTARAADIGSWKPLGPGNIGGRTRALLIHPYDPNTMWAGAVSGGVWKTIDGGASWQPTGDLLPSLGISALAMDPRNPDVIYAGTGEWYTGSTRGDSIRGIGIFKSSDGGASWNQLPTPGGTSFYYINKIVVSPNDSNRIYAATYGGVWLSMDGGSSWIRTLNRTSPDIGCQDLVIRTDKAEDYLFASCLSVAAGTQSAIFRNEDAAGAGRWQSVLAPPLTDRTSLAIAPSNQNIIYAMAASQESGANLGGLLAVYRSSSNGDANTWETRTSNKDPNRLNRTLLTNPREAFLDICSTGAPIYKNQGQYDNALAVDPLNPDVVWAGGIDVFRSDDGGANWGIAGFWQASAPQWVHSDVHVLLFPPGYGADGNQTFFAATDGGVYRTDNALAPVATGDRAACSPYPTQVRWTGLNNGYAATQFYHGAVYPGGAAYAGGAQDTGTNLGTDAEGPNAWRRINSGDGGFVAIDPKDPNTIYMETTGLSLVRSTNGGISSSTATRGITEASANFLFITPFEMDPSESKRLYMAGQTLWRTADGAQNWTEASAPIGAASGSVSAIAISPSDPNRVLFGTSAGLIFRGTSALTSDKTTRWLSAQPRSGYLSRLAFDPQNPDVVYATYSQYKTLASQSHVYKSTDGGANWVGIDGAGASSIPDIPVFSVIVDPRNPSSLYLGTDIGVFVSLDGGVTWSRDDNPFANAVTEVLALDRGAGQDNLFAFTHGRGVWKTALPGSGGPCLYDVPADPVSLSAFGATLSFNVTAADGCVWSAVPAVFAVQSPAGGSGNGKVTVVTAQNLTAAARVGGIAIQDKRVPIRQEGALVASDNDDQATPFDMGELPNVTIQNTSSATSADGDPVHSCTKTADAKTAWFSLTANDTGSLRLSFASRRLDTGSDSGVVISIYDQTGKETMCSVMPQGNTFITTRTLTMNVTKGDKLLIEASATLSGAAATAQLQGGNLSLAAQMLKP
jgi:hypothetical protein